MKRKLDTSSLSCTVPRLRAAATPMGMPKRR
jgi:hypothetical protein